MKSETLTTSLTVDVDGAPPAQAIQVGRSKALLLHPAPGGTSAAATGLVTDDPPSATPDREVPAGTRLELWKRASVRVALAGSAVLCVCAAVRWWTHSNTYVKTDNAYLAAHIHQVSSRVAGTVKEVLAEENHNVRAGAVLARLDPSDCELRLEQAKAEAAQAEARIEQAHAQAAQARAQVAREQAQALKAKRDLQRAEALAGGSAGAISRQELDQARAAWEAAEAARQASESALQSALSLIAVFQAQAQAANAALRDAELQLTYTEIRAPADGRIGRRSLEAGNRVQSGQALLAVVQPEVWVIANFKETQLTRIKAGMPVEITVDTFPGQIFKGEVESLSPASGSQFALLPPDNATGNFTRIVQRIPVKVVFHSESAGAYRNRLVPGMSAMVRVKVR
jgi:membrane fusion protein (multidrug efflux system)